ncbi:putative ribonuclease H-like domain-containing protein, partial [Tanacetum coccineum]
NASKPIFRCDPFWGCYIDVLTKSMNYKQVVVGNQSNGNAGIKEEDNVNSTNNVSSTVNAASTNEVNVVGGKTSIKLPDDPNMPELEDYSIFKDDEDVGAEANMKNLDTSIQVSPILTTRIQKIILLNKLNRGYAGRASTIQVRRSLDFSGFTNWKRAIGTKYVFRNKKDERGIVIRNKARLVAQWYTQEEGIDYDESDFLYDDIIFGSTKKSLCTKFEKMMHKKFQMSSMGELTFFLGLQGKQKEDGIFIGQDKYVTEILKKFGFTDVKTTSTPMETQKPLLKDEDGEEVDVYLYRSMIGSLMYLISLRPDIMFAVCACARYQINPKVSHLHAVKRIFRYLKGQPKLGLWYLKDSPFDLVAYTDSDYVGASLDRKYTIGGCQFLRCRLISWRCKKQTVVANSITEAEYVAASSCCGQVLWIQNQLLDYGYKFMHAKIYIDN